MKTPFLGICQEQANSVPVGWENAVAGMSAYFTWRELETNDQGGTLNGPGLARIQSIINYCQSTGHIWKMRLFTNGAYGGYSAGRDAGAPAWVKADSAIPKFRHMNSQDQNPYSGPALLLCGYWSARWKTLYTRFISHLGALLDGEATLHDVTVSFGMMLYAEPLILDINGVATNPANSSQTFNTGLANRHELVGGGLGYGTGNPATVNPVNIPVPGAGFTDAAHMAAMQAGLDAHTNAFPNTPQSFSFNPYQTINPDATATSEGTTLTKTKKLIDYAAARGCVLENNSARPDYFTYSGGTATGFAAGVMPSMYQYMRTKSRPIFIQTANQTQITNPTFSTVKAASEATMSGVIHIIEAVGCEPVPTYKSIETTSIVSGWNTALIANYGSSASAPSFNGTVPGVTGTPQAGQTLVADPGTVTGFPAPTITYQWQTSTTGTGSWTDITGATTNSYLVPSGQVGKFLRVHVIATNASGTASANSASTTVVTAASSAPVWTVQPFVTGTVKEGSVLTANTGTVTGSPAPTITYQWETSADGTTGSWSSIGGATSPTYTLPGGSAGSYKRCKLTATNTDGTTNAWTPKVGPVTTADTAPSFTVAAAITGNPVTGDTLTLTPGTATGTPTPTLTQQWQRSPDGSTGWTDISGETSLNYQITTSDAGGYIRAVVTATNGAGTATSSDSVGPVTNPTVFPDLTLQVTVE